MEVENESNVALKTIEFSVKLGNLVSLKETWTGILLPGAKLAYNFKSDVLSGLSQKVVYVCGSVALSDASKEITPGDNSKCLALDSLPSLVDVYPNPAEKELFVEINSPDSEPLELRLINGLGQESFRFSDSEPGAGVYRRRFDLSKISSGIYTIWFRSGEVIQSKRIVILKN